jgi:hypothetical protein
VPQYSLKLCTYDPTIIDAFERLRENRKQAAFTHAALNQFLSTEKGGQVLQLMEGIVSEVFSTFATLDSNSTGSEKPDNCVAAKNHSSFIPQSDSCSVLNSIMDRVNGKEKTIINILCRMIFQNVSLHFLAIHRQTETKTETTAVQIRKKGLG